MHTIGIVNLRGGSGKTTLALHLAAQAARGGKRTVLIDTNPQGSASWWGRQREAAKLPAGAGDLGVTSVAGGLLVEALSAAARGGTQVAVIDTPPTDSAEVRTTASLADLALVPVAPSVLDAISLRDTILMLREAGAFAFGVITRARFNSLALTREVRELVDLELPLWEGVIHDRIDYVKAPSRGLTAPELSPNGEHRGEIAALWSWVWRTLVASGGRVRPAPRTAATDREIAALQRMAKKLTDAVAWANST